jgi:hypothetical protein
MMVPAILHAARQRRHLQKYRLRHRVKILRDSLTYAAVARLTIRKLGLTILL